MTPDPIVFDAYDLSRTWLAVAIAQSDDDSRPMLDRTTLVEWFPTGIRLVSTDSYLLLRGWVPAKDTRSTAEPATYRRPQATTVVRDVDQRGLALFKYLRTATNGQPDGKADPIDVVLSVATPGNVDVPTLDPSWAPTRFRVEAPDHERLLLDTYEGTDFPKWRPLFDGHQAAPVDVIGLAPTGLLRLGGLAKTYGGCALRLTFSGPHAGVLVQVEQPGCTVQGLAMPSRLPGDTTAPTDPVDLDGRMVDPTTGDVLDQATVPTGIDDPGGAVVDIATKATRARKKKADR